MALSNCPIKCSRCVIMNHLIQASLSALASRAPQTYSVVTVELRYSTDSKITIQSQAISYLAKA